MSNIPYPDVPPLAGVPPISRSANQGIAVGLAVAAELYALYKKLKDAPKIYPKQPTQHAIWGILYEGTYNGGNPEYLVTQNSVNTATINTSLFLGNTTTLGTTQVTNISLKGTYALKPDSFVKFEYKVDHKIPTYPIQNGGFASYNKIALPYEIKLIVTKSNIFEISSFINQISILLNSTRILSIVTPDKVYNSVNLIHFDYKKEAVNGAVLLIAELTFQEVRVIPSPADPVATPQADQTFALGQVSPLGADTPIGTNISDLLINNEAVPF
jgi:hypothetical protein